jgi:hypothetical protein
MDHHPTLVLVPVSIKWASSLRPVKNQATLCAKRNKIKNPESNLTLISLKFLKKLLCNLSRSTFTLKPAAELETSIMPATLSTAPELITSSASANTQSFTIEQTTATPVTTEAM